MKSAFIYTMILGACFFVKGRNQGALKGEELCGNHSDNTVNLRFENSSPYDFNKMKVFKDGKEIVLNRLESGKHSCFESFAQTGRQPGIEVEIKGRTYRISPAVFRAGMAGNLDNGYYNCSINIAGGDTPGLTLEFNRLYN
ncbi:MAG TPA: hypothetical protein VD772_07085 [Anseongella sp.]|nr:hypothetical protein [Anseongella sp.]